MARMIDTHRTFMVSGRHVDGRRLGEDESGVQVAVDVDAERPEHDDGQQHEEDPHALTAAGGDQSGLDRGQVGGGDGDRAHAVHPLVAMRV